MCYKKLSAREIARIVGCSQFPVLRALKHFGITVRSISESRKGKPSTAIWTPEMRESMAMQRRGSLNPMFGTISPWRGRHKPEEQTTRHYGRGRARALHLPRSCEECGDPQSERHHISG